ncbi:MAG: TolC family outer membrane protein [Thermomicrobiales bacterium]|nr:TolC family outer membrane protein [Thermomicrobiales bacterium]
MNQRRTPVKPVSKRHAIGVFNPQVTKLVVKVGCPMVSRAGSSRMLRISPSVAWITAALVGLGSAPAGAETLTAAMASAYVQNATLNSARAGLRATDEGVNQALAGRLPGVSASAGYGRDFAPGSEPSDSLSLSLSIEQPIFDGFRTRNGIEAAETAVLAGREALVGTEQDVLLQVVSAYMNLVRDNSIVGLSAQNLEFLREQLRAARNRLDVGEGTQTEVAQTQAREASAMASYAAAVATQTAARAVYEQIVGHAPNSLTTAPPVGSLLPRSAEIAVQMALESHPDIKVALYNVDTAGINLEIAEGSLWPTVSLSAGASRTEDPFAPDDARVSGSVGARVSVPIFTGGERSSNIREAKQRLGQREIDLAVVRARIRADVISAWGDLEAATAQVRAAEAGVAASQLALSGIVQERDVGQRTTLDVLDAQQDLLDARTALVRAQRDRVVASYALLAATGGLTAANLGLPVQLYDPASHYTAVRGELFSLTTPDGR